MYEKKKSKTGGGNWEMQKMYNDGQLARLFFQRRDKSAAGLSHQRTYT